MRAEPYLTVSKTWHGKAWAVRKSCSYRAIRLFKHRYLAIRFAEKLGLPLTVFNKDLEIDYFTDENGKTHRFDTGRRKSRRRTGSVSRSKRRRHR